MNLETCKINIEGKDYTYLKPTAVELIEIEDKCLTADGGINEVLYAESILRLVSAKLSINDLVKFNNEEIELTSGDKFSIPEIPFKDWDASIKEIGRFSRVEMAKLAIKSTGVSGEIKLDGFKYQDIDAMAHLYFSLYDTSVLKSVIDEVTEKCFS